MPPPIRVKPSSILPSSSRGSLLDGAYTAGVAYATPLRRGQMSPRLVLFLAAFTTLLLLVSNFNTPAILQPPLENQTFMEDYGSPAPAPRSVDIILWVPPPRHHEPVPVTLNGPAVTSLFQEKCPREPTRIKDEICELAKTFTNFTDALVLSVAAPLLDSMPTEEVKDAKFLLATLALFLLAMLWSLQASRPSQRCCESSPPPRTLHTNKPVTQSFVESWDSSTGSFIPAISGEQLYFTEHEEVLRTINGLSASRSNSAPTSPPLTKPRCLTVLRRVLVGIWSCGMELVADVKRRMPVGQEDAHDYTCGTNTLSPASSTGSLDVIYEEVEVEEIGVDYLA